MKILSVELVFEVHHYLILESGGSHGLRDRRILENCLNQYLITFEGQFLYSGLVEKAAALGFSLVANHPFVDGNKRVGHAAMEIFLKMNGYVIDSPVDTQEAVILGIASGKISRENLTEWLRNHVVIFPS
ncbi:MAG: type II toxin-antitoxin system death-on-curing family toxin [Bacteroidia bacterium]